MFSPKLYTVRKIDFQYIAERKFRVDIDPGTESQFFIREQDNLLFRQIRKITNDHNDYNKYMVFINCKSCGDKHEEALSQLILNGFSMNGQKFVFSERSASMTRNSILSFVDQVIADELSERVTCGANVNQTVLSKYYAYRGLMLSSCHCMEGWQPKMIVIPDCYQVIPHQRIKHLVDTTSTFTDQSGSQREWISKDIAETVQDVKINAFDGCGIHHPQITKQIEKLLGCDTSPTSVMWRAPFIKGMTHEVDYTQFYADRGVKEICDIWGTRHGVTENDPPMAILTESMYKGLRYFKKTGTHEDWDFYWAQFKKYDHCLGIARWNFSIENESVYTRANYQILQDLKLEYDDFAPLAKDTVEWIEKIIQGDPLYTYCFLGLFADKSNPLNNYTKAILKNPEMLKEYSVRDHLISLVNKKKDEMKCGKLWVKGSFKFLVPDLIMLMEHAGGLPPNGFLSSHQFFSQDKGGAILTARVIERNPHICHSEHTILMGTDHELRQKYCPNLANVCMINCKSITPQKINGADFDGDAVLLIDNDIITSGITTDGAVVMDIDDKISAAEEPDTMENKVKIMLRTKKNLIGEYSNYATAYWSRKAKDTKQQQKYEQYIEIISILTGKAIDYAKTGILYLMPSYIAKYGRPLPYFMKYRSDYYKRLKLSRSKCNLNRLCWELEKWEKQFRWKRTFRDFDYTIMMDYGHLAPGDVFQKIEDVFLRFCSEMKELKRDEMEIRKEYKDFNLNWDYYYQQYQKECEEICPDRKMLANVTVKLCYEKYPNANKKFIWRVAGSGVVENIRQVPIRLPLRCHNGDLEYLGQRYRLIDLASADDIQVTEEPGYKEDDIFDS